jgi:ribonucleoside-diphosphate reductase alpha chain
MSCGRLSKNIFKMNGFKEKVLKEIPISSDRDSLLTAFGKKTLDNQYLLANETYQQLFARVSRRYSDNYEHALRMYEAISRHWFMPATPVLSNGGTKRGLPISCFLNEVIDSLEGIVNVWDENVWLASRGGGNWYVLGKCALYRRKNQ